jgi:3-oxoadipate enol-lactonase
LFDLAFGDQGHGEPVVLLPPFPLERRVFAANLPALTGAGFRAIAIDYPGFGPEEPALPAQLSISGIADRLAGLLHQLAIDRATLVGLSMGGYVALAFAARFPERLRALVLADTRAAADTEAALRGRAQALDTLSTRGVDAYLEDSLPRLLAPGAPPPAVAAARDLAVTRPEALLAGIAALRDRPDRQADARAIACPTLVVCGGADQVTPPAEMKELAASIPHATYVELPGVGHLSNLEAPEAFSRAVVAFLTSKITTGPDSGASASDGRARA